VICAGAFDPLYVYLFNSLNHYNMELVFVKQVFAAKLRLTLFGVFTPKA
jgi:hypothetical protein